MLLVSDRGVLCSFVRNRACFLFFWDHFSSPQGAILSGSIWVPKIATLAVCSTDLFECLRELLFFFFCFHTPNLTAALKKKAREYHLSSQTLNPELLLNVLYIYFWVYCVAQLKGRVLTRLITICVSSKCNFLTGTWKLIRIRLIRYVLGFLMYITVRLEENLLRTSLPAVPNTFVSD